MLSYSRWIASLALILLVLGLSACSTDNGVRKSGSSIKDADIIAASHEAATALIQQSQQGLNGPIIVASLANIDNLDGSSSFGRIVGQQLASAFANAGHKVIEMLLRNNVYIKQGNGEFLLSRNIRNLSAEHNVQTVVVGTYAVGAQNVYVTAKLISVPDSLVIASHDFALPLGPDTKNLLRK